MHNGEKLRLSEHTRFFTMVAYPFQIRQILEWSLPSMTTVRQPPILHKCIQWPRHYSVASIRRQHSKWQNLGSHQVAIHWLDISCSCLYRSWTQVSQAVVYFYWIVTILVGMFGKHGWICIMPSSPHDKNDSCNLHTGEWPLQHKFNRHPLLIQPCGHAGEKDVISFSFIAVWQIHLS